MSPGALIGELPLLGDPPRSIPLDFRLESLFGFPAAAAWIILGVCSVLLWLVIRTPDFSGLFLLWKAPRTTATITKVSGGFYSTGGEERFYAYTIDYSFVAPDGIRYDGTSYRRSNSRWDKQPSVGDRMPVEYRAGHPAISRLVGMNRGNRFPVWASMTCILFICLFLLWPGSFFAQQLRAQGLLSHGRLAKAALVSTEIDRSADYPPRAINEYVFLDDRQQEHRFRRSSQISILFPRWKSDWLLYDPGRPSRFVLLQDALSGVRSQDRAMHFRGPGLPWAILLTIVPLSVVAGVGLAISRLPPAASSERPAPGGVTETVPSQHRATGARTAVEPTGSAGSSPGRSTSSALVSQPSFAGDPPRSLRLSFRIESLLGDGAQWVWAALGVCCVIVWVIGLNSDFTSWFLLRKAPQTMASVKAVSPRLKYFVGGEEGGAPHRQATYTIRYSFAGPDGKQYEGESLGAYGTSVGMAIPVEYRAGNPAVSRLVGMSRAILPAWAISFAVIPVLLIVLILIGFAGHWRTQSLLSGGELARASLVDPARDQAAALSAAGSLRAATKAARASFAFTDKSGRVHHFNAAWPERRRQQGRWTSDWVLYDANNTSRVAFLHEALSCIRSEERALGMRGPGLPKTLLLLILPLFVLAGNALAVYRFLIR